MIRYIAALLLVIATPALAQPSPSPPSSVLTLSTSASYAGTATTPQLIASSATAGSIVVPTFGLPFQNVVPRVVLTTNHTSGWGNVALLINLWVAAPTYSTGDGTTYTVATGAASWRAQYACTLTQAADGAFCAALPVVGSAPLVHPGTTGLIYWDIEIQSTATGVSGKTFTLTPELWNF